MKLLRAISFLSAATILNMPVCADVLADSTADFSGVQGAKSWYYGYFPGGSVNSFTQLPKYALNSQQNFWQQATFGPPWTLVGANSLTHPNDANTTGELQWTAREWVSTFTGAAVVSGRIFKADTSNPSSTGVYGRIYLNHSQIWSQYIAGTDGTGVTYSLSLMLNAGDVLDFALAPNGSDSNDLTVFSGTVSSVYSAVSADFGVPVSVTSTLGVLNGFDDISNTGNPPAALVSPLRRSFGARRLTITSASGRLSPQFRLS